MQPRPLRRLLLCPRSRIVRPTVAAAEESESMATELSEPMSAHPSPAGRPTSLGRPGAKGPMDYSLVGVSTLGYPSGQAGPSETSVCSDVQVSPYTLATGIAETRTQHEASPTPSSSLQQPPIAATETAAAQRGLTRVLPLLLRGWSAR